MSDRSAEAKRLWRLMGDQSASIAERMAAADQLATMLFGAPK